MKVVDQVKRGYREYRETFDYTGLDCLKPFARKFSDFFEIFRPSVLVSRKFPFNISKSTFCSILTISKKSTIMTLTCGQKKKRIWPRFMNGSGIVSHPVPTFSKVLVRKFLTWKFCPKGNNSRKLVKL